MFQLHFKNGDSSGIDNCSRQFLSSDRRQGLLLRYLLSPTRSFFCVTRTSSVQMIRTHKMTRIRVWICQCDAVGDHIRQIDPMTCLYAVSTQIWTICVIVFTILICDSAEFFSQLQWCNLDLQAQHHKLCVSLLRNGIIYVLCYSHDVENASSHSAQVNATRRRLDKNNIAVSMYNFGAPKVALKRVNVM